MKIVATFAEARADHHGRTGLVPTMGFLHEGHVSLLDAARESCDHVVMSLFVNPLQFDESRDLSRYPRDLERDAAIARAAGVDVVLAPTLDEMYHKWPPDTVVQVPPLSGVLEGEFRPGHFDGVATVVTKLLAGVQPDVAFFGRKDGQQLAVVTAMARDLSLPVEVKGMPIVREPDGLALSSRNVFLTPADRAAARHLSAGLMVAADAVDDGLIDAAALAQLVEREVEKSAALTLEYVTLAAQDDLELTGSIERPSFLSLAGRVGSVRLIDNIHIDAGLDGYAADRGTTLETTSMLYSAQEAMT